MNDAYARLAWCYDNLASLAFAGRIRKSQLYFLNRIIPEANVLILGGGTGWIAQEVLRQKPNIKIVYVDASSSMMKRARARLATESIRWIEGDETQIPDGTYDAVILPFILDSLADPRLIALLAGLKRHLHQNSIVLVTDFTDQALWHRLYLKFLYWFFKITTNIQRNSLSLWEEQLKASGYVQRAKQSFFNNFIITTLYTLPE